MKFKINKKIDSLWILIISFFYLEILFRLLSKFKIFSVDMLSILLFDIFICLIIKLISSLFKKEIINKVILFISIFLCSLIYIIEYTVNKIFGFYYSMNLLSATAQVGEFASDGVKFVGQNIIGIILLFIPFILVLIFRKCIMTKKNKALGNVVNIIVIILVYGLFYSSLFIKKNDDYSRYKLYHNINNIELSIKRLGVLNGLILDINRYIFGFKEKIEIITVDGETKVVESGEITYNYNNLNIDFDKMISNSSGTIKEMHNYFKNEMGTLQNEYTGMFKDKNLIMFMAESFNEIAVDEKLTPTLYKLVNNGFVFDNFYTPTISSTIGGEFQEVTGLVAASGFIKNWKAGTNSFPYGLGKLFKDNGFSTYAYHNHNAYFQSRNNYLPAIGFDNFKGCNTGLESKINCKIWPESDVEMINATFDDYAGDEHFFVYYVSVSGHGDYVWSNAMSRKHRDKVEKLEYSDKVKAYLAAQIEFDKALELLIQKLDEKGILNDTVIAFVGDHYPYYLSLEEINEVSDYKKDDVIEINRSNFVLWNNDIKTTHISKIGSQIDVLPTIYNIFGIPYDSRIIIGKDILSSSDGLAIFGNRSWISDYGKYYASKNHFEPTTSKTLPENYVKNMNIIVSNKMNMSKLIITEDYYKSVLEVR